MFVWKNLAGAAAPQSVIDAIDYGCRSAGAPRGVAYAIAELESSFDTAAVEKSTKAAGLLQIKPEYLRDYQRMAGVAFDPLTVASGIAAGPILASFANTGRARGFSGDDAWRFAIAAHRWGAASDWAQRPAACPRVLDVEAMMKANGVWYDTPQPNPDVPVLIQLPLSANSCYRQATKLATSNGKADGLMIHSNGCQYVPAWHWPIRWNNADADCAVHFFIDAFGIVQALPDTTMGWHAGGAANRSYLSVEQSEQYTDDPAVFAEVRKNVRWLVETMRGKHGFPIDTVIGHCEGNAHGIASNHGDPMTDPGYVWSQDYSYRDRNKTGQGYYARNGYSMDALRADIASDMGEQASPPPAPSEPAPPSRMLWLASPYMTGADVKLLQLRLKARGCNPGPIDGIYGPLTNAAVRKFQSDNHLVVDCIVGPITWGAVLK